jgi:hypothetical protein
MDLFNPLIVAIGHDLNKVDNYKYGTKNVKDASGKWQELMYYDYKPARSMPSNVHSSITMSKLVDLSESERDAIYYAEGSWSTYNQQSLDKAWKAAMSRDIRVYLTHTADMISSQFMEPILDQFELSNRLKAWSNPT